MPNWTQISGVVDRLLLVGLSWAVAKGYILPADVAPLASLVVAIAGSGYALYVNRNTNLIARASTVKDTTVVTTPAIAIALPQSNVVSSDINQVVPK